MGYDDLAAILPQHGKILLHLGVCDCRYPVAHDPEVIGGYWFCGKKTRPGEFYCTAHLKLCRPAATTTRTR